MTNVIIGNGSLKLTIYCYIWGIIFTCSTYYRVLLLVFVCLRISHYRIWFIHLHNIIYCKLMKHTNRQLAFIALKKKVQLNIQKSGVPEKNTTCWGTNQVIILATIKLPKEETGCNTYSAWPCTVIRNMTIAKDTYMQLAFYGTSFWSLYTKVLMFWSQGSTLFDTRYLHPWSCTSPGPGSIHSTRSPLKIKTGNIFNICDMKFFLIRPFWLDLHKVV